jgi:hypothetical protein
MAQPPKYRQITFEVPDEASWFSDAEPQLQSFVSSVTYALDKKLTRSENFASQKKVLDVNTVHSPFPLTFDCTLSTQPEEIRVAQVQIVTTGGTLTGAVTAAHWDLQPGNKIRLYDITGLASNTQYTITLIIQ